MDSVRLRVYIFGGQLCVTTVYRFVLCHVLSDSEQTIESAVPENIIFLLLVAYLLNCHPHRLAGLFLSTRLPPR